MRAANQNRDDRGIPDLEAIVRAIAHDVMCEELARERADHPRDEYLSTEAAARFADVAVGTIRRWVRESRLPEHRAGRRVRVRRSELERLLRAPTRARAATTSVDDLVTRRLAKMRAVR